jgi:DnaJ domain
MVFIVEIIIGLMFVWLARSYIKTLTPAARFAGGMAALVGAVFLVTRGQVGIAVPLGVAGLGLLGWMKLEVPSFGPFTLGRREQISRLRSAFLDVEIDHGSGAMRGRIIAGPHRGTSLDALDVQTLVGLFAGLDAESRALLAAYLDRRHAGWREYAQRDPAAGGGAARGGPMTQEEAYQILGLQPGASIDDISRAHRGLMKKLHPDQGGTNYLAARVNEAKDTLLRRHR